ncbi:MAG: GspE/PulE family protein [bacterium]|nr:GspE/PulE family protein [bacterium]
MNPAPLQDEELLNFLLEAQLIGEADLRAIKRHTEKTGLRADQAIADLAILSDEQIGLIVADLSKIPFTKVGNLKIPRKILDLIPGKIAKENLILPMKADGNFLQVATNNIHQAELLQFLEKKTKKKIKLFYAATMDLKNALRAYEIPLAQKLEETKKAIEVKGGKQGAEAIANLLDDIIYYASQERASDIHIEPQEDEIIVRVRMDGDLHDILFLPKEFEDVLITRVKVLANLKTDEHRAAQDGRIKMDFPDIKLSLRVSVIPIHDGEKVVLRLLAGQTSLNLESLGYTQQQLNILREVMQKTHGMILVTGPTGSGKTTTLYSVLRIMNTRDVNISTVEDPVEIRLPGVNQVQVNNEANLTFANGLRSMLRQDPDILLVGEIRDTETANIAVNAALTGHIVFATLHTNDAASTLPRLLEMGVQHFLVASTVNVALAQRLARRVCPFCIQSKELSLRKLIDLFSTFENFDAKHFMEKISNGGRKRKTSEIITIYEGKGCNSCNQTGFYGRVAVAEFLEVDKEIRKLISKKTLAGDIIAQARKKGMMTMMEDGLLKSLQGLTTPEEVIRITRE